MAAVPIEPPEAELLLLLPAPLLLLLLPTPGPNSRSAARAAVRPPPTRPPPATRAARPRRARSDGLCRSLPMEVKVLSWLWLLRGFRVCGGRGTHVRGLARSWAASVRLHRRCRCCCCIAAAADARVRARQRTLARSLATHGDLAAVVRDRPRVESRIRSLASNPCGNARQGGSMDAPSMVRCATPQATATKSRDRHASSPKSLAPPSLSHPRPAPPRSDRGKGTHLT